MLFYSKGIVRHLFCVFTDIIPSRNVKHCFTTALSKEFNGIMTNLIPTGNNRTHIPAHDGFDGV